MRVKLLLILALGGGSASQSALAQNAPATSASGYTIIALQGQVQHLQGRELVLTDNYGNDILKTQIPASGRFAFRARWKNMQQATLRIGREATGMWLTPGDNLTLTVDSRQFAQTLRWTGRGSRANNYRATDVLTSERVYAAYQRTLAGSEAQFRAWLALVRRQAAARLAAAFAHPTVSEAAYVDFQRGEMDFLRYQFYERRWDSDRLTRPEQPAPAFVAHDQRRQPVALASLRGKVVYVDFWASWCGFCLGEAPAACALHAALADRAAEVAFLNVSTDDDWDKWQCALEKHGIEGLNVVSPDSGRASAGAAYRLPSLPRYVLIGRDGRILDGNAPRPSSGRVEALIRRALAGPAPAAHPDVGQQFTR